jgi:hypothetical protein
MKKGDVLQHVVLLAAALFFAQIAAAQNCSTPPQGSGEVWWQEFVNWCSTCKGTPNPADRTCTAGANWGKTTSAPVSSPPIAFKPETLVGQWTLTANCGNDSGSETFNIDSITDGVITLSGGAWNCKFETGRIEGNRVTLSCSNWLNKVDYQGTLVGNSRMQGTMTQRLRSETCHWSAVKAGTALSDVSNVTQAGQTGTPIESMAGTASRDSQHGDVFIGTITKGNFAKGWGMSVFNIKIYVTAKDGTEKIFYIRQDSVITYPDGTTTNLGNMRGSYIRKMVEIRYAPIQDDTGGSPSGSGFSYQIGQNGVLTLRFLE